MTIEDRLLSLGLKKNEVAVYMATLVLGEASVGNIAQKTGLHKQIIYNTAQALQHRALLTIREVRGRRRFRIDDPSAIERMFAEQLRVAQQLTPELYAESSTKRTKEKVRVYRGIDAIQNYYKDSIRKQPQGSHVRIVGMNSVRYFEIFPRDGIAFDLFERVRLDRKIHLDILLFGEHEQEMRLNKDRKYITLSIAQEQLRAPMDVMIWHDHVGMLFYGDEPYVLDVIGSETVEGFGEYFSVLQNMPPRR
jgi:sugar-specific transcriptional regulator TrmB